MDRPRQRGGIGEGSWVCVVLFFHVLWQCEVHRRKQYRRLVVSRKIELKIDVDCAGAIGVGVVPGWVGVCEGEKKGKTLDKYRWRIYFKGGKMFSKNTRRLKVVFEIRIEFKDWKQIAQDANLLS